MDILVLRSSDVKKTRQPDDPVQLFRTWLQAVDSQRFGDAARARHALIEQHGLKVDLSHPSRAQGRGRAVR